MDYNKLIGTLSKESKPVYYTVWNECVILFNPHAIVLTNEDANAIPEIILTKCERNDEQTDKIVHYLSPNFRDSALFTGISFTYGTREINVYMARRADDSRYPVFIQRKYAEMVGTKVGFVYGTGTPTDPLHIHGLEAQAIVFPVKINKTELKRLVDTINEVNRLTP